MPWENNGGGGGRNNNGGPWGQAPGGGGGGAPRRPGGGNTPNLEDILNRGRDQFRGGIPGGRWAIIGGVLALVAFWALNSIYTIDAQEVGVELRFGAPKPVLSMPGLHFHLWPIETVERVTVTENQTTIGSATGAGARGDDGLMLSGDQNIVDVRFSVLWSVSNPIDYLFNVRDPEAMVRNAAESAMREVVGRRPAQDIFRDNRQAVAQEVKDQIQKTIDNYHAGIAVNTVSIEDVSPPKEVSSAFDEVQKAEQDEDRMIEQANQYANKVRGQANGEAAKIREEAAAYKNRIVKEAEGEAARFLSVYEQYKKAPEITRKRLYLETMEKVLTNSKKVITDQTPGSNGVLPLLPLNDLAKPNDKGVVK